MYIPPLLVLRAAKIRGKGIKKKKILYKKTEICDMFTGIIEAQGIITQVVENGTNRSFTVKSLISKELKVDQSVSHNGVCLTVESVTEEEHTVTAILETLQKTDLGDWKTGDVVNLERCLSWNGRLDGHIVQGHVDGIGVCVERKDLGGSWEYTIEFDEKFAALMIEKGSISLNGISLTAFNVTCNSFTVAIIPYTFEHTNMHQLTKGKKVNLEFDMVGKYVQRFLSLRN